MANPYKMKTDQTLAIGKCRACGERHTELVVHELTSRVGVYTHFYYCPSTFDPVGNFSQPVMLALYEADTDKGYAEIAEELADRILVAMAAKQFMVTVHHITGTDQGKDRLVQHYWSPNLPRSDFQAIAKGFAKWAREDIKANDPDGSPEPLKPAVDLPPAVNIMGEGTPIPVPEVDDYLAQQQTNKMTDIKELMAHPGVTVSEPVTETIQLTTLDRARSDAKRESPVAHAMKQLETLEVVKEHAEKQFKQSAEAKVLFPPKPSTPHATGIMTTNQGPCPEDGLATEIENLKAIDEEEHPNQIIQDLAAEAEQERVAKQKETK